MGLGGKFLLYLLQYIVCVSVVKMTVVSFCELDFNLKLPVADRTHRHKHTRLRHAEKRSETTAAAAVIAAISLIAQQVGRAEI